MLDLQIETARSINGLAEHFQMSRLAVSQHLCVLLDAGPRDRAAAWLANAAIASSLGTSGPSGLDSIL